MADEDELDVALRLGPAPLRPVGEELATAFALDDAADVEDVVALDAEALAEAVGAPVFGDLDADAEDVVRHALVAEAPMHHRALLSGVERDRARRVEHGLVDREEDRGLIVRRRHEYGALRHKRQAA